jgi:hypothetical protein
MRYLKLGGIIFGAVLITALGIDAADTLQGSQSTLLGQLASSNDGPCPVGMVHVPAGVTFSCVDTYEASAAEECPILVPSNTTETQRNIVDQTCAAESQKDVLPWNHITREQAQLACVRSSKRLPTNEEWYMIALGTPDSNEGSCNISGGSFKKTGTAESCVSAVGVFDTVGNLWEWTSDDVLDQVYNGRTLPEEGYVVQVDKGGVATQSSTSSEMLFGEDYIQTAKKGAYAIMRGGFYGSRNDAGVYTVHAKALPTTIGPAIGFRCVQ